jgi:hypothetical protein
MYIHSRRRDVRGGVRVERREGGGVRARYANLARDEVADRRLRAST